MKPALSLPLLLSLPFRHVPPEVLQPVFSALMGRVQKLYPAAFGRLEDGGKLFCINPVDLPFSFLLDMETPQLHVVKGAPAAQPDARISGSFEDLLSLLDGRKDGDALFFSGRLVVEGSTEAVVALRNAIDGENVSLSALLGLGASPVPLKTLGSLLAFGLKGIRKDFDLLAEAFWRPTDQKIHWLEQQVDLLKAQLAEMRKTSARQAQQQRLKKLQKPLLRESDT